MSEDQLSVQNVKCGGCASRIRQGLAEVDGVESVEVDVATGVVTITGDAYSKDTIVNELSKLGYPVSTA